MKYIAYYDDENNKEENRIYSLSATNKIKYVCSAMNRIKEVEIVSPSWTLNCVGFYNSKEYNLLEHTRVKLLSTFGARNPLSRRLRYYFSMLMLLIYLLTHVKTKEKIMVYHSISLYYPMKILSLLKKINLILEVEEIYQDVQRLSRKERKNEYKFFKLANSYIFSTILLHERINNENKPYLIIHGTYQVEEDRGVKFDDGKIHVVYAGTFDPRKGGALAATAAAEFLPDNYHLHIIGFGSEEEISIINDTVKSVNKNSKATVSYDGLLSGEDYILFLQKCHIGLSTQNPDAEYNDTSFPSKILSYMANGLRVVTVRIKALETSAIGNEVFYYDKQNPKNIAKAIMSIDFNEPYDSRKIIKKLNNEFSDQLNNLLNA